MEITRENLLELIKTGIKRDKLSISGLERNAGVPKDTIRDFLRGKTQILRADKLQKILRVLEPKLHIAGEVQDSGEIIFMQTAQMPEVDCPQGFDTADVTAVRVRGNGLLPVFHDGWVIYYSRRPDIGIPKITGGWQVPYAKATKGKADAFAEFLGKPCIVGLAGGRALLGTLKRPGSAENYSLTNHNANDIRNIKPEWAAKIILIKPE